MSAIEKAEALRQFMVENGHRHAVVTFRPVGVEVSVGAFRVLRHVTNADDKVDFLMLCDLAKETTARSMAKEAARDAAS